MDTNTATQEVKKPKTKAKQQVTALRVKPETRKKILLELAKANKKEFGRKVKADDIIAVAINLVEPHHIKELQEATLSNQDRLEREFKAYIAKHGPISKDSYLGKRLRGEIASSGELTNGGQS